MLKKIKKRITKEAVDEINKVRKRCGFPPTKMEVGETFTYYVNERTLSKTKNTEDK